MPSKRARRQKKARHRHDVDVVETAAADDDVSGAHRRLTPRVAGGGDDPMAPRSTIAIADDGSPDPVHVEGDLGQDGGAKVLAEAGGDQRRQCSSTTAVRELVRSSRSTWRRPRRGWSPGCASDASPSSGRSGRRRLKWLVHRMRRSRPVVAGLGVLGSGLFAISTVEVEGGVQPGRIARRCRRRARGKQRSPRRHLGAERQLEAIPWVADARSRPTSPRCEDRDPRARPMVAYLATTLPRARQRRKRCST